MSIHISSFTLADHEPQVRISPGVHYSAEGRQKLSATLVAVNWGENLSLGMDYAQAVQLVSVLGAALADYGPDTPPVDLSRLGL
ncbi:hypothetical protein [Nocardia higoensis]|uniref:hypothetical protein n=1 Tax=Nocardia higoensis TaxID=228599 RepID=UPI0002E79047|nr:hypothetical protein [Nocardia higoensis]